MTHRPVGPDALPVTRCGRCGYGRNPYRHGECPVCHVDDGGFWLVCERCSYDWLAPTEHVAEPCPRCEAPAHYIATRRAPDR